MTLSGGRFDFNDGGTYCGGWEAGRAHGHGICTGPNGQGEFAGSWSHGFEVIGVYTWPSGNTYNGNWSLGKRHGLGVETKGRWQYKGEWTHGFKGRYGVRSSTASRAKYEGTWSNGLQDGYGTETYADEGTYQGQWMGGMRHGYGVRRSAPYGMASCVRHQQLRASMHSLRSDHSGTAAMHGDSTTDGHARGGFVLGNRENVNSTTTSPKRKNFLRSGLRRTLSSRLKKRSKSNTSIASNASSVKSSKSFRSDYTGSSLTSSGDYASSSYGDFDTPSDSFHLSTIEDDVDLNAIETYRGQWKNDKRDGFGVCERSDGFKYQGEWLDNQRHGYGSTVFPDGSMEEGKYKHNIMIASRRKVLGVKTGKVKEKVDNSVKQAVKVAEVARQKAEIAVSRTGHGIAKAEQAELVSQHAREEAKIARCVARDLAPDFHQPGLSHLLAKGEDPFRELDQQDDYTVDRERIGGVAGPESYQQYSSTKEEGSVVGGSLNATAKEEPATQPSPSQRRRSSFRRLSIFGSKHKLYKEDDNVSIVAPSPGHVSPSPARKDKHLSPNSAFPSQNGFSNRPNTDSPKLGKNPSTESDTPSKSHNTGHSSSPNVKHGFFRSLLHKPKKSHISNSKSSDSAFSSAKDDFQSADKESWDESSAEAKRTLWKKSVSTPEAHFSKYSLDKDKRSAANEPAASHDGLREQFIANYENEMFTPLKSARDSTESWSHYEISHGELQSRKNERVDTPDGDKRVNPQIQITIAEDQSAVPPEVNVGNDENTAVDGQQLEARKLTKTSSQDSTNNATTVDLISPAFADYNTREGSEASDAIARRRLRDAYLRKQNQEDPCIIEPNASRKYSPLPTRLRHNPKVSFVHDDKVIKEQSISKIDTNNSVVVILVVVLILGFAAVFTQFLA